MPALFSWRSWNGRGDVYRWCMPAAHQNACMKLIAKAGTAVQLPDLHAAPQVECAHGLPGMAPKLHTCNTPPRVPLHTGQRIGLAAAPSASGPSAHHAAENAAHAIPTATTSLDL